jgi:catechol 2,3-dioxygenase-like lactoylglutathione lyase family enzyme
VNDQRRKIILGSLAVMPLALQQPPALAADAASKGDPIDRTSPAKPMIDHLDHIVLTTYDEDACVRFYVGILGMELETFGAGRKAFRFGNQKINVHVKGHEFEPKADKPTPGSLDICFISSVPLDSVIAQLNQLKATIVEGPVIRTGATSKIRSVYLRDPDQNLIEISELHP